VAKRPASPGFDNALDRLLKERAPAPAPSTGPVAELQFSRHALARLQSRGVQIDEAERGRLNEAVDVLHARGAKESLVLTPSAAYVVGVPKRTVITAMPRSEAMGNVFSQIDSTYIAP